MENETNEMIESEAKKAADEKFCHECGAIIKAKAEICPKCGVRQPTSQPAQHEFTGQPGEQKCLKCGYQGQMKTWLSSGGAKLIAIVLFLCYIIPGVIFVAYFWNKYKCPRCGAIGETIAA